MLFWIKVAALYALAALASIALIVPVSRQSVLVWLHPADDSPVYGMIWVLLFLAQYAVLVPISLAITGELIERRTQKRSLSWTRMIARCGLGWLALAGLLYWPLYVAGRTAEYRPPYAIPVGMLLFALSGVCYFYALRIRRVRSTN